MHIYICMGDIYEIKKIVPVAPQMLIDVVGIPSDPDGDLDVVEDLRCPPMSLCNYYI